MTRGTAVGTGSGDRAELPAEVGEDLVQDLLAFLTDGPRSERRDLPGDLVAPRDREDGTAVARIEGQVHGRGDARRDLTIFTGGRDAHPVGRAALDGDVEGRARGERPASVPRDAAKPARGAASRH